MASPLNIEIVGEAELGICFAPAHHFVCDRAVVDPMDGNVAGVEFAALFPQVADVYCADAVEFLGQLEIGRVSSDSAGSISSRTTFAGS